MSAPRTCSHLNPNSLGLTRAQKRRRQEEEGEEEGALHEHEKQLEHDAHEDEGERESDVGGRPLKRRRLSASSAPQTVGSTATNGGTNASGVWARVPLEVCRQWSELVWLAQRRLLVPQRWAATAAPQRLASLVLRCDVRQLRVVSLPYIAPAALDDALVDALSRCENLDTLQLSFAHAALTDAHLAVLTRLPRLRTLELDGATALTRAGLAHLRNLPQLTALSLAACSQLSSDDVREVLSGVPMLQRLDLSFCMNLTRDTLTDLAACPSLTALRLLACAWCRDDALTALRPLRTRLRELDLAHCKELTAPSFVALSSLTALRSLSLAGAVHLDDAALAHVAHLTALTALDLDGVDNVTEGALRDQLPRLRALQRLSLARCRGVSNEALKALQSLVDLEELSLEGCSEVTEDALRYLAHAERLRRLSLRGCTRVADLGLQLLAHTLPALTALDLGACNAITSKGIAFLSAHTRLRELNLSNAASVRNNALPYLARLTELRSLDLRGIAVSDEYVGFLSELSALRRLSLAYNPAITDAGLDQLNLTTLTHLDLSGCEKPVRHASFEHEW